MIKNTIAICGASGLVGTKLFALLYEEGHNLVLVGRNAVKLRECFPTAKECLTWEEFPGYVHGASDNQPAIDAVVNLAGAEVLGGPKWDEDYKEIMTKSRVESTKACASAIASCKNAKKIRLITSSSVHAYGLYHDDNHGSFCEGDLPRNNAIVSPQSYLHGLTVEWESATKPAIDAGASVATCRFGVVLDSTGGALAGVMPMFKAFLGGPQGTGRQVMPWISLTDVVHGINFLLKHPEETGPVNFSVPSGGDPNQKVMHALGEAMDRPTFIKIPAFACRLAMGDAVDELVLTGQRVTPKALLDAGYVFHDTDIDEYLKKIFNA